MTIESRSLGTSRPKTDDASDPTLADLVRRGDIDGLERAWLEEMTSPGEAARYLDGLDALADAGETERASLLAGMLLEAFDSHQRRQDVLALLRHLAERGFEDVSGTDEMCAKCLRESFGDEPWFDFLVGKAGLDMNRVSWRGFCDFHRCMAFLPGSVVLHRSGWGEGKVESLDPERDEVEILFASGKRHTVPWQSARDTMDPLPDWDLRAMRLVDPQGVFEFAKKHPVEALRRALRVYRGKANATQLKEFLHSRVVPARSWASWWKKAKSAAVEDPLIAVEGSTSRPVLSLRSKALTLAEEAREALRHEKRVHQTLVVLRSCFERATRDSDRRALTELAQERLEELAASDSLGVDGVQALIFLEELGEASEEQAIGASESLLRNPETGEPDFTVLVRITEPKLRCRVVQLIPKIYGDRWLQVAAQQLARIPDDCEDSLELLVELMREGGDAAPAQLREVYERVTPFPTRHPFLLYLLTKAYAEGQLEPQGQKLDKNVACRVIMHVLRVVSDAARGSRSRRSRMQSRIATILTGKSGILERLVREIDRRTMQSILRILRGAGEDFPAKVQEVVERAARQRFPDLNRAPQRPFWDDEDRILSTRHGLEAREKDFRHLRDVLIPANSKSIGAAASQGDLSENAEWEAAMEEQRTLTARAAEWETELAKVKLIEQCEVPDGCAAPGTRVELVDLANGEPRTVRILGPWDGVLGDDVVSYRAPVAAALLGRAAGDEVTIELPSGVQHVRILDIHRLY